MVNADEYYGIYLKGEDVTQDIPVTIKNVVPEKVEDEEKLVVYFHEIKKGMTLNKTNKDRLKEQFGTADTDKWIDGKVTLTTEEAYNPTKKENAPALRIKPVVKGTPAETLKPAPEMKEEGE